MDWIDRMRKVMAARDWNQTQLATALEIGTVQVSRLLNGHTKEPSKTTQERLVELEEGKPARREPHTRERLLEFEVDWLKGIIRHGNAFLRQPYNVICRTAYDTEVPRVYAGNADYAKRIAEVLEVESKAEQAAPALLNLPEVLGLMREAQRHLAGAQSDLPGVEAARTALVLYVEHLEARNSIDSMAILGRASEAWLKDHNSYLRHWTVQPFEIRLGRPNLTKVDKDRPVKTVWRIVADEVDGFTPGSYDAADYDSQIEAERALAKHIFAAPDGEALWDEEGP